MDKSKSRTGPRITSAKDAAAFVTERGSEYVKVGVFDIDGVLRGKYISRDKFIASLDSGFGFCDVVLGWDSNDTLYGNPSNDTTRFTGWHTAFPDAPVRIIPETGRVIPFENDLPFFLGEFGGRGGELDPRAVLRRVLERAERMGLEAYAAFEYEFFVFDETPQSIRAKGYRDLQPFTPGNFGYSVLRNSVHAEFYHRILDEMAAMRVPIEGLHTETGPGVLEAAIEVSSGLEAADRASLFKTFVKVLCQREGKMATFMAKWSKNYPGQSGHIHLSLRKKGESSFFREGPDTITDTMRHFIGGQQQLMPEFLAMVAPTVNSYTRLIPGYWAPTSATWGIDNRTCALRAILGSAKSQRVEYRISAADANPYLALAAALGSGLWGVEHAIEPQAAIRGNAYEVKDPDMQQLPTTLLGAAQNLKASSIARAIFGDPFVDHFAMTREWEEHEFRKHITDWELERYFEII
jgi:glutamine synthetase